MDENERQVFLSAPHIGIISINRLNGNPPLSTPVWYNYSPGGDVTVLIEKKSAKYRLLLASGGFTLTVQNDQFPYGYVSVTGEATIEDTLRPEEVFELANRYRPDSEAREFADAQSKSSEDVLVRMRPCIWFGQDFTKS
jgi:hypothetical protein